MINAADKKELRRILICNDYASVFEAIVDLAYEASDAITPPNAEKAQGLRRVAITLEAPIAIAIEAGL